MKIKKILFLTNHLSFFVSHRINIFFKSKKKSYNFFLISGSASSNKMEKYAKEKVRKFKIKNKILNFNSYELSIFKDIKSIINLYFLIKNYRPNILHTVAPKTNLYGGLVSLFLRIDKVILSFSGLGFLFTGKLSLINKCKKKAYIFLLRIIFLNKSVQIIVQNTDDYKFFLNNFNLQKRIKLIKGGSGINLNKYNKIKIKKNIKNVVFSGRLVINKGIREFIDAAKTLKKEFPSWNFIIYGALDYQSHDEINLEDYKNEIENKIIIVKGYEKNIVKILKTSSIYCLPSYREGMPKSVLEAAAAGIPCIVSDAPGCKESVINNKTGFIVRTKDHKDLINKIRKLIINPKLRNIMSHNSKKFVKKDASILKVTKKIFDIYEE